MSFHGRLKSVNRLNFGRVSGTRVFDTPFSDSLKRSKKERPGGKSELHGFNNTVSYHMTEQKVKISFLSVLERAWFFIVQLIQ